ncbi:hypothetical protein DSO57_1000033 [Entomophthora muscae]|uniref:Uncharacterized protein n=1 Tax=Entomophthora muscae TaxID=34485 RepID=A0ACC2SMB9_9FUNG|nr:hypothetical protein DSO57_1000033 [Entomophthora muscae]
MILPVLKFMVFSVAPFLLLLWSTSPELWTKISSSACLVGNDLSRLLDIPSGLLFSGEAVVKSLICDNLDLGAAGFTQPTSVVKEKLVSPMPSPEKRNLVPLQAPTMSTLAPTCTPWLLTGLVLMGLNAYFPQLSPVLSLWSPLQEAVPVLHWVVSWWYIVPGWKPNLVSLSPLSYSINVMCHVYCLPKVIVIFKKQIPALSKEILS